jgi:hypothetical protein
MEAICSSETSDPRDICSSESSILSRATLRYTPEESGPSTDVVFLNGDANQDIRRSNGTYCLAAKVIQIIAFNECNQIHCQKSKGHRINV